MLKPELILILIADLLRTLLAEELSKRVASKIRALRLSSSQRGMAAVRQHTQRQCRRRLLYRLSTMR